MILGRLPLQILKLDLGVETCLPHVETFRLSTYIGETDAEIPNPKLMPKPEPNAEPRN